MSLRVVSWNVNSLRSAVRQGFAAWLKEAAPDIVCLQEIRAELKELRPLEHLFPGYQAFWHPAVRPGYAGVAILSRFEPLTAELGLHGDVDAEGRAITLDYGSFRVASLYAPNAPPGTPKLSTKCVWLNRLQDHVTHRLDKLFIVCGDLNVAHTERDSRGVWRPSGINGCTDEERKCFQDLLDRCELIDPLRERAQESIVSTWWHAGKTDRKNDNGIRFDYVLVGADHQDQIVDQAIHPEIFGSDHCPVSFVMDISTNALKPARSLSQIHLL